MKQILLIICIFSLLLSCSDDEKAAPDLTVIPSILEFDNTGSTKKIYLGSNTPWASKCDQEWCTVSITQKFGNDTVDVQVSENTGSERIAYIVFSIPEQTIIKTVKVIQKAKDGNVSAKLHSGPVNSTVRRRSASKSQLLKFGVLPF
jgi:hypothetical protein